MGLYIMPISVHTTQHSDRDQAPMGCIPISTFPVPVPISVFEQLHRYCKLLIGEIQDILNFSGKCDIWGSANSDYYTKTNSN